MAITNSTLSDKELVSSPDGHRLKIRCGVCGETKDNCIIWPCVFTIEVICTECRSGVNRKCTMGRLLQVIRESGDENEGEQITCSQAKKLAFVCDGKAPVYVCDSHENYCTVFKDMWTIDAKKVLQLPENMEHEISPKFETDMKCEVCNNKCTTLILVDDQYRTLCSRCKVVKEDVCYFSAEHNACSDSINTYYLTDFDGTSNAITRLLVCDAHTTNMINSKKLAVVERNMGNLSINAVQSFYKLAYQLEASVIRCTFALAYIDMEKKNKFATQTRGPSLP